MLGDFARELRLSARGLARTPAWTLSLVLTIALGIGSNASVDGFVRGLLNHGPPVDGDAVSMFSDDGRRPPGPLSFDQIVAIGARSDLFRSVGAVRETQEEAWLGKRRLLVSVAMITADIADLLQLPGGTGIVISHRLWYDEFVSVPIDGQSLRINGADRPVTGVAPNRSRGCIEAAPSICGWSTTRRPRTDSLPATGR